MNDDKTPQNDGTPTPPPQDETVAGAPQSAAIDEGTKKVDELTNALARCMADLQNYRRRSEEDKARFVKFANAELLKVLLPALENLDRSCKHLPEELKENAWAKGVLHTQSDLTKALALLGVTKIETVGKKLDLKFHEVLIQGPGEKDVIIEDLDPGYLVNGEVLKAAKVKVGDGTK
ncbi:nucleotide exchange factor GrpE [Candidatus Peregrinibacteria bacterium]|nr:nucleotide exchange factor GrpE [Candidatus Peregrinibacteria bacterium]